MRIKRFTAPSVKDALRSVKAEFGDQALILSNKKTGPGEYEVVAAIDYDLTKPVTLDVKDAAIPETRAVSGCQVNNGQRSQAAQSGIGTDVSAELKKEIRELKELKELCMSFVTRGSGPLSDVFVKLEEGMVENGIDKRLARKILMNTLSGVTKDKATDIIHLKSVLRKQVYERIGVKDPFDGRGIVAFVGPSGAGKTTTVAKLAAISALKEKKKVALLSMDTYRIAAAEQLKVYGRLIGVPVEVANDATELKSFIKMHSDKDMILIDTAGRSQKEAGRMLELNTLSAAHPGIRLNLVLNSQTRDEALYDNIRGFGALPIDSLTFTRLDEGSVHGSILNAMILARKPVAYLSTGSRVPQDIERASREKLLNYFMPN